MEETEWLADRFDEHRIHMRAVAYRMLGSLDEADDAVQDAWLRISRAGAAHVENLGSWMTTIVARVCLNKLRSRRAHPEEPYPAHLPDPVVTADGALNPEDQVLLADSVGLALQVVLDTLSPAERLAFVLHDVFDLPFDEIAPMVERSSAATRQLASRARRRVRGAGLPDGESNLARQRAVVDAFFAAARAGDFAALLDILDPDVVLRTDFGAARPTVPRVVRGATEVSKYARPLPGAELVPVLVNGSAGVIVMVQGRPISVLGFIVARGRIVEIDGLGHPERVARVTAAVLGHGRV